MIPKKIHYCWFGRGEKPELAKKCIASWKKYCPDYELIEWNEDNFDVSRYPYAQYCLDNRKYAFLSDFVRLAVIKERGGIYFDTDVELVGVVDGLLEYGAFYGFENDRYVNTGQGFGAEREHPSVCAMYEEYKKLQPDENGDFALDSCPRLNTKALIPFGLKLGGSKQMLGDVMILSADYMNPFDNGTGVLRKTANTLSIHWYSKSWMSKGTILRSKLLRPIHRIFGDNCFDWVKRLLHK